MVDWSLAQSAPNFASLAQNAFMVGQKQGQERMTRNALAQYATDPDAGKNALLQGGDLQTYGQVQGIEQRQQQAQRQDQEFQDQQAAAAAQKQQQLKDWAIKSAVGLRGLAPEARAQAFIANVAPTLKSEFNIPDEQIAQTVANGISDQALDGFIAELGGPGRTYQSINTGNGGVSTFEPATGRVNQVQVPTVKPPTAPAGYAYGEDGKTLAAIPGGPADPRQAGSLAASRRVGGGRAAPSGGGLSGPGTNTATTATSGPLTPDAIDQAARQYAITGKLPALGMKSSAEKSAIMNRAAALQGADPTIPATAAKYKADSQALNAQAKTRQAMETAEQTALSNMDLAIEEAKRGSAAPNIPFVSGALQKTRVDGLHNAGPTKLRNYVQAAANEAAKVLAGGTGGQGATDAARREAEARFNEGMPLHQLIAARDAMRAEMASRVSAASKTEADLHDRLASYIKGSGPASAAQHLTPEQAQALPPGTKFIGLDGVERTRH